MIDDVVTQLDTWLHECELAGAEGRQAMTEQIPTYEEGLESLNERYAALVSSLADLFKGSAATAASSGARLAYRDAARECRALARSMRGMIDDSRA